MMKKIFLLVFAIVCAYTSMAQNNVYGKKVVGLDSLVSDTIRARTQANPYAATFQIGDFLINNDDRITFTGDDAGEFLSNTSDGSDNKNILFGGGGGTSFTRGATMAIYGNEVLSFGGGINLTLGDATTTADLRFRDGNGDNFTFFDQSAGYWDFLNTDIANAGNATIETLYLSKDGDTDSIEFDPFSANSGYTVRISGENNHIVNPSYFQIGQGDNATVLTPYDRNLIVTHDPSETTAGIIVGTTSTNTGGALTIEYDNSAGNEGAVNITAESNTGTGADNDVIMTIASDTAIVMQADYIAIDSVLRVGDVGYSSDGGVDTEIQGGGGTLMFNTNNAQLRGNIYFDGTDNRAITSAKGSYMITNPNGVVMAHSTNTPAIGGIFTMGNTLTFSNDGSNNWDMENGDNKITIRPVGSLSVTNTTNTTFYTIPDAASAEGIYVVNVRFQDGTSAGAGGMYFARGGDRTLTQVSKASSGAIDLAISGRNIQVYQASGSTKTVEYSITRLTGFDG